VAEGQPEQFQNGGDIADGATYVFLRFSLYLWLFLTDFDEQPFLLSLENSIFIRIRHAVWEMSCNCYP
jgi:hypothetical protein